MININTTKITFNEGKLKKLANAAQSQNIQNFLIINANTILKETLPKIPYNVRSAQIHLRDKYTISKPLKTHFKINGLKYPSTKITIKPKGKYQIYYAVVTAGNKNGKNLNYTNPLAEPYALENTFRKYKNGIKEEAINILLKEAENINNE